MSWIRSCKRIPNYSGWWDLVLKNANESTLTKTPLSIPFEPVPQLEETNKETPKPTIVYLNNQPIPLPQKPLEPDNCCMSGCVHW
ncbi:uncharacterized protein B0P05DRAFT_565459 [Gilbertella persicaria]|uniref:uncharacterized protein n=1 Tax=Gilbertella persicaria TaxID=101096 RepID=UPI00221F9487|nr:uncharacterized protein B0P05DRAFT_565459 [Gilbertella persicaria]KAI8047736.1 hypothetical protein B0P05DRAFT_565459 [Gilbertella persicaria]